MIEDLFLMLCATATPSSFPCSGSFASRILLGDDTDMKSGSAETTGSDSTETPSTTEFDTIGAAAAVAETAGLSTLIAAVTAANLTGPLSDPDTTWTIFAPNDEVGACITYAECRQKVLWKAPAERVILLQC
jgi:hypothetical protein